MPQFRSVEVTVPQRAWGAFLTPDHQGHQALRAAPDSEQE